MWYDLEVKQASLTAGSIPRHLARMTLPTIGGVLAITIFSLTDTLFVARLGTDALAAMGFTFPVVMVVGSLAMGLGTGAASVLSRALGRGDHGLMRRAATDGLFLAMAVVAVVGVAGLFTMDPLFRALGASESVLPLVRDYMGIWYWGVAVSIVPPVGDGCLRATGDMVRPLAVMMTCALLNVILDPIMIYGLLGFPRLELVGASLATVLARFAGMVVEFRFLTRAGLLDWHWPGLRSLLRSWRLILHVGLPAGLIQVLMPLSRGWITGLAAAAGGATAVAALAAGSRIESLAMILPMAYGIALMPLVGQNFGGGHLDRVDLARRLSNRLAIAFGALELLVFLALGPWLARGFSSEPEVIRLTARYLWIVCAGHAGQHLAAWTGMACNAAGKPGWAAGLNLVQTFALSIPFAWLGSVWGGFTGMLAALAAAQLLAGVLAVWIGRRVLGCARQAEA
jgi:putative MATE family efflux protein